MSEAPPVTYKTAAGKARDALEQAEKHASISPSTAAAWLEIADRWMKLAGL